jgi:hypothetical protein
MLTNVGLTTFDVIDIFTSTNVTSDSEHTQYADIKTDGM